MAALTAVSVFMHIYTYAFCTYTHTHTNAHAQKLKTKTQKLVSENKVQSRAWGIECFAESTAFTQGLKNHKIINFLYDVCVCVCMRVFKM